MKERITVVITSTELGGTTTHDFDSYEALAAFVVKRTVYAEAIATVFRETAQDLLQLAAEYEARGAK